MSMSHIDGINFAADVGQFLIPIAAGVYSIYQGNYEEAASFALLGMVQKKVMPVIKRCIPRQRPNGRNSESCFSSHAAGAFLGVGFLVAQQGSRAYSTSTAINGAALVGFSRWYTGEHWPTDILSGAAIGFLNGRIAGVLPAVMRRFF